MTRRILIAYASKYGSTEEIARRVGEELRSAGLGVDVRPAEQVVSIDGYDSVIVGSAVYIGGWRKEAISFLETFEQALADLPVWLFSSGPTGEGDPVELLKGWQFPEAQKELIERLQPRGIAVFHGALDNSRLNLLERMVIRGVKAPLGDFRDWESISAWAHEVASELKVRL